MKFADTDGIFEILIYFAALVVGLILNVIRNKNKKKQGAEPYQPENTGERPVFPDIFFEPVLDDIRPEYEERQNPQLDVVPENEIPAEYKAPSLEASESLGKVEYEPVASGSQPLDLIQEEGISSFSYNTDTGIDDEISESFYESIVSSNIADSESDITGDGLSQEKEHFEFDVKKAIIYSEILKPKFQQY